MSDLIFCPYVILSHFSMGGTNENGQPTMAAMAELLKCAPMDVKQLTASNYALHLVAISTDALVV